MSMPLDYHRPWNTLDQRLLDRLVDGEIANEERRELLRRLESEPDGWRRCALAFLEAQAWWDSLADVAASPEGKSPATQQYITPNGDVGQSLRSGNSHVVRLVASLIALSACLTVAFATGWILHKKPAEAPANHLVANAQPSDAPAVRPAASDQASASATVASQQLPPAGKEPATPLDALVKKWEQRGYRAERQERLVPMETKDGRKVTVPVQEFRFQYMGGRTY